MLFPLLHLGLFELCPVPSLELVRVAMFGIASGRHIGRRSRHIIGYVGVCCPGAGGAGGTPRIPVIIVPPYWELLLGVFWARVLGLFPLASMMMWRVLLLSSYCPQPCVMPLHVHLYELDGSQCMASVRFGAHAG